ncbi:MAG TPA: phosphate ABC transporter permease PstA [Candidatus Poseidoniaceae archaeon]|nr:phosphate ABC transporter permease PstA [Candidatus Poseidoniaceae archaeon]HII49929.1 phosphate ABC transporter permease PstA [Candidatus Poseidoniaceae archaeon]
MKERPSDYNGLFGTSLLPQRSLKRRYATAKIGKSVFISIALVCGLALVTLLTQITEEAFVPEQEIEVDGIREGSKPVAQTQLSWKAESWNPSWEAYSITRWSDSSGNTVEYRTDQIPSGLSVPSDATVEYFDADLRIDRSNITIEAKWEETHYVATRDNYNPSPILSNGAFTGIENDTDIFTSIDGQSVWDLDTDLERALCNEDLAEYTYKPVEPWKVLDILPGISQDTKEYSTGEEERINIFKRPEAPTPGMGDYWVDSDDGSQWVWKGLRWDSAEGDEFLNSVLDFSDDYPHAFKDGKLWLHYTPVTPIFRGDGDIWLNRSAIGIGEFSEITVASIYNQTDREWRPLNVEQIPEQILRPQEFIGTFTPEFCTKAETSAYILSAGLTGEAVVGEFKNDDGYEIQPSIFTKTRSTEFRVTISNTGHDVVYVNLVDDPTGPYFSTSSRIAAPSLSNGFLGEWNYFERDSHITLKPSGGVTTNWLYINHTMNYTVTYSQTSGPANDALETSYREIGDFALGSPADWFQFRFIDDDDLDNDGTIDVCDLDIDGDNDENPIIGHPKYCPEVGRYEFGGQPMSIGEWISVNDADGDGVHDEVKDRDIDGDGIANLVQGQGISAGKLFNYSKTNISSIPVVWQITSDLYSIKCSESYKQNDPQYADFDCDKATTLVSNQIMDSEEWCDTIRYLDQLSWLQYCGASNRLESGLDMYEERDPYLPMFAYLGLIGMFFVVRYPNRVLLSLRSGLIKIGSKELDTGTKTPWSWLSFSSEVLSRLFGVLIRLLIFIGALLIFISTFNENQPVLLVPFSFTIGGAVSLMSFIALITAISDIIKMRPDENVPLADGLVDFGVLVLNVIVWYIALSWILIEGWVVGAVLLLMSFVGAKKLVIAALQLTRTNKIQEDRLGLVIKGRDGWMTAALVVMVIALFTIPMNIHIPFVWSDYTSSEPYKAGLRAAFWGSVYVVGYTMLFAIPLSIGAAIWLEEYAPNNSFRRGIQALITNLAGVPAIVFGLFGLALFLTDRGIGLGLGGTVMTAGMTMATMAMPTIVISSQEALRAVPPSLRNAAFGLGCTKWQVTKDHVLPHAMPGMMTGTILAMSRIMGEAAPLILVGAVASVFTEPDAFFYVSYQYTPSLDGFASWFPGIEPHLQNIPLWADRGPMSADPAEYVGPDSNDRGFYTVLPVQVYRWTDMPKIGFKVAAAGASIVLLGTLVIVNSAAILLRAHFRRYSST